MAGTQRERGHAAARGAPATGRPAPAAGGDKRYWPLTVVTTLIVVTALYPFDFTQPGVPEAAWAALLEDWFPGFSTLEIAGETALFAAFGAAGALAFPPAWRATPQAVAVMAMALVLAVLRQIVQIYVPPWAPALGLILCNAAGAGLGIAAGLLLQRNRWFGREIWKAACVPAVLLALWLAAELLPFVPTFGPQWIKDVVKALLRRPAIAPLEMLWHAAGVLVAGRALAQILPRLVALPLLALLLGIVAAGKIVVVSQVLTASAAAGFAAGFALWVWLSGWQRAWRADLVLLAVLLGSYTLGSLQPFDVRSAPTPVNWMPFGGVRQEGMLAYAQALAASALAFAGVLGIARMRGSALAAGCAGLALWVVVITTIQVFVAGRAPGITEPLLVLLVGLMLHYAPLANATPRSRPESGAPW